MTTRRAVLAGGASLLAGRAQASAPLAAGGLKIGVLTEMGGTYAEDAGPGSVAAVRLAVADFQAEGGFGVEVISGDAQTRPDVASALARSWYDRDGVDLVVDVPVSNCALAVATVARERNKAAVFNTSTSELTGRACSPNHVQWTYDTYALGGSTARALLAEGGRTWFLIQADYTFGANLAAEASAVIAAGGGRVLGTVRHPFPGTTDFSSYLLAAQASGAQVVGLANAGTDAGNCIKQAGEFGLQAGGTKLAALQCLMPQIRGVGLEAAQGLYNTESFYWDLNDATRAWSLRWEAAGQTGLKPSMIHAGCYSGVLHYLRAVATIGAEAGRADGRKIHAVHLFRVKAPVASKGPWDLYDLVHTTPGDQAFRPLALGGCPLIHT